MTHRIVSFASSLAALGALCLTGTAVAQTRVVERETVTEKGGPSAGMLASGIVAGGISYGAAATVALTSDVSADHRMIVPLVGPWLALSGRPACGGATGLSCDTATSNRVLIATDGVFQAVGAFLIVDAFLNPRETTVTTRAARAEPRLHLLPTVGANGYGLAALGQF